MRIKTLILILIFAIAALVRLYNFPQRLTFGSEQARSLVVSGNYIKEKPSLLGQEYFRTTSEGHKLFSGAIFSYTLVPLQLIFNFSALPITYYFAFLNLFTGFVLFWLTKKVLGYETAVFATILFLFNDYMIYHTMFIWILNYYPLIGVLALYLLYLFYKKKNDKHPFFLGLISGVAVNFHYLFIPFAIGILVYIFIVSKKKIINSLLFILGGLLGDFTMVLFDARHDFYHLRTLFVYAKDVFNGVGDGGLIYYHFLHLWPLFAILGAILLVKIWKVNKAGAVLIVLFYTAFNLTSNLINFSKPTGMPDGLVYSDIVEAAGLIAKDTRGNFNVSSLLDFDKRGYILRYPVEFMFDKKPMGVEDYPQTNTLYAIAETGYNFSKSDVWEITSMNASSVDKIGNVGRGYSIYKLTK